MKRVHRSRELPAPLDLKRTGKKQFPGPGVRTAQEAFWAEVGSSVRERSHSQTTSSKGKAGEQANKRPTLNFIPPSDRCWSPPFCSNPTGSKKAVPTVLHAGQAQNSGEEHGEWLWKGKCKHPTCKGWALSTLHHGVKIFSKVVEPILLPLACISAPVPTYGYQHLVL